MDIFGSAVTDIYAGVGGIPMLKPERFRHFGSP